MMAWPCADRVLLDSCCCCCRAAAAAAAAGEDTAAADTASEDTAAEDVVEDGVDSAAAAGLAGIKEGMMVGCKEASRISASSWTSRQATPLPY